MSTVAEITIPEIVSRLREIAPAIRAAAVGRRNILASSSRPRTATSRSKVNSNAAGAVTALAHRVPFAIRAAV